MASKDVADNTVIELQPNWVGKLFGAYKRLTVDANSFYIEERSRKQTLHVAQICHSLIHCKVSHNS